MAVGKGVTVAYDPLGRFLYGGIDGGGVTTSISYDGPDVLTEVNHATGARLRRYVYGPGADEPLIWYEGSGFSDRRWLHADERGSIIAVTNDAGNAIAINRYDDYGIPQAGNIGRFQYTGQKWLPTLGLYDYKARMYSPTLGRFFQTDPIGYGDGLNWYNYVGSDPVNMIDPMGLCGIGEFEGKIPAIPATGPEVVSANYLFRCFALPDGGGSFGSGGGQSNYGGGGGSVPSPGQNPAQEPQNEKKLSQCMINFIGSQGYNTNGLGNVTFYRGSLTAQLVYNTMGNPAITIGNSIHVASSAWGWISSPSGGQPTLKR